VTLLREAYRRRGESKGGSVQYWLDRMTDDVSHRSLSGGSSGGSPAVGFECATPGKSAVEACLAQITSEWEMVHYTPREYVAPGDRVAVPGDCAWRSRRTGRVAEFPFAQFFTFRDGKIAAAVELFDSAAAVAAHAPPPA
jgi:ketosteroid isomerase-like protein